MMLILVMLRGLEMNVQRYAFLSMWRKKNFRPGGGESACGHAGSKVFFNTGVGDRALRFHIVDVTA